MYLSTSLFYPEQLDRFRLQLTCCLKKWSKLVESWAEEDTSIWIIILSKWKYESYSLTNDIWTSIFVEQTSKGYQAAFSVHSWKSISVLGKVTGWRIMLPHQDVLFHNEGPRTVLSKSFDCLKWPRMLSELCTIIVFGHPVDRDMNREIYPSYWYKPTNTKLKWLLPHSFSVDSTHIFRSFWEAS